MEKVGKGAVMQADRDGRAGRGGSGETEGGKRWRQRIKVHRQRGEVEKKTVREQVRGKKGKKGREQFK